MDSPLIEPYENFKYAIEVALSLFESQNPVFAYDIFIYSRVYNHGEFAHIDKRSERVFSTSPSLSIDELEECMQLAGPFRAPDGMSCEKEYIYGYAPMGQVKFNLSLEVEHTLSSMIKA